MNPSSKRIPPECWPEVSDLFDQALALPSLERDAWLAEVTRSRPEAAAHLRGLLTMHGSDTPLTAPDGEVLAAALFARLRPLAAGTEIDIYRLIAPLGEGGMATVWSAEQQQGVRRRVALKLPHKGIEAAEAMARRFALERDVLASLEHPHIARLYAAGVSADGQPYLALEQIDGQPITRHCEGLPLRRRLLLFLQVLEAVSFAHGRLVIHRDLKPSNILVTPQGQVKLLDFGIARMLGAAADGDGAAAGSPPSQAFTPDSASPEQLAGATGAAGAALSAASDVYSLGVVLYELLTGQRPYTLERHGAAPLAAQLAAAHVLPPSAAVAGAKTTKASAKAARQTPSPTPSQSARQTTTKAALAGDLDAIVARAMAHDLAARYPSAEALAADLHRHLDLLPVLARGDGRAYRAALFMRRQRLPLVAGAAVVLALAAGLGLALWQAEQAQGQARRAQAVQRFLVQVFEASQPEQAQGREISAKALLDRGAQRVDTELADQPAVRAELHGVIGRIYVTLGDNTQARRHVGQALALYTALGQPDGESALDAQVLHIELLEEEMQFAAARAAAERTLQHARRAFGPNHRWTVPVQAHLAWIASQQGDPAGAEALARQTLAAAPAGSDAIQLLRLRGVLAHALLDQGRYLLARDEFAAVVVASATTARYETTDLLADRYNLARARYNLGEYQAVAGELARLVPEMDRHIGARHDRTLKARSLWAQSEAELGRHTQALEIQRENLAHALARDASDEDVLSLQRLTLAKLLRAAGRYAEGVPLAAQGLAFFDTKYLQPTWLRERGRWVLGELLLGAGLSNEGLAALERAAAHAATLAGFEGHTIYADLLQSQALALRPRGRAGDATRSLQLITQAEAIHSHALGASSAAARRARLHRLWLAALAQPANAEVVAEFVAGADDWGRSGPLASAGTTLMRAEWLARAGHKAQAQQERTRGAALWQQTLGVAWSGHFTGLH